MSSVRKTMICTFSVQTRTLNNFCENAPDVTFLGAYRLTREVGEKFKNLLELSSSSNDCFSGADSMPVTCPLQGKMSAF